MIAGLAAFAVLTVSACGSSAPTAGEVASSTSETTTSSTAAGPAGGSASVSSTQPTDSNTTEPSTPQTTVPATDLPTPDDLDPDTAFVWVEGREYLFAVGTEFANICEMNPSSGFGDAKMHLIDGDFSGVPNLHVSLEAEPTFFIIQIGQDIGYVAGSGENVDPIADYFDVVPPAVTLAASDGAAFGEVDVVNVFTDEVVPLYFVVRCG